MKRTSSAVIAFIVLILAMVPVFPAYAIELWEDPYTAYSAEINGNDPDELMQAMAQTPPTAMKLTAFAVLSYDTYHTESIEPFTIILSQNEATSCAFDTGEFYKSDAWGDTYANYSGELTFRYDESLLSLQNNVLPWAMSGSLNITEHFTHSEYPDETFTLSCPPVAISTKEGDYGLDNCMALASDVLSETGYDPTKTLILTMSIYTDPITLMSTPSMAAKGWPSDAWYGTASYIVDIWLRVDGVSRANAPDIVGMEGGTATPPPYDTEGIDGIEDIPEETSDWGDETYDDEGLSPIAIGGIAVGSLAVLVGIIVALAKTAAAKAAAAAAAAQAAAVPETVSYQPEVYDWRGNRIDENARVRQTEQEYVQANRETQAQLDAERERIRLAEEVARQREVAEHNAYVERLSEKYFGTASGSERAKAEMAKRILENRGREETLQKYIGRYQRYSHGLETLTGLVESGSDIIIDVGGDLGGPVGKGIRAGYKVIKPAIKNFCERGSTVRSVLSAAIKGAGDAASDFLPADGKGKKLAKQMAKKAGVQFTGELTGELIDEGGSVSRAVYNTAVKTVINTAKDEIGGSRFISGSATKLREGGKRYLLSTSGTLAENSLSMKGAK